MEFLYSLSLAFSDLSHNKIRKISIVNGIFWAVVWLVVGFLLWSHLVKFTTFMINFLPFKFIQNAGADFILMIIWLQVVLVTIGIFFSLFNQILSKKFLPVFVSLVIALLWFSVFFIYQDTIINYLQKLIRIFPFETVEQAVSVVLSIFVFYSLYIVSMYISFLFLSVRSIENLKTEQYPQIETKKSFSFFKLLYMSCRDLILFVLFLFILYPLLFIPFLNVVIIVILWSFLIKESLVQTVFMVFGKADINNKAIWFFAVSSVLFNFIPIVNIFAPAFGVLSVYRYVMEKKEDEK